jgi:uncharacterized protein (TIGR02421 family)
MPIDFTIDTIPPLKNVHKDQRHPIFDIDANIDRIVRRIELLAYINPLNIALERKRFYQSKYTHEPQFKYRKLKFNPYKVHRLLFSQRLERIDNEVLRSVYQDVIYNYSGLLQCIETIEKDNNQFYFNSLRFYGTPTEKMVENAKFILHFENVNIDPAKFEKSLNTNAAIEFFTDFRKQYDFDFNIKTSSAMSASAMVSNSERSLILKKAHKYSEHELNVLAHHEIGVHLLTTFNAVEQPLKIFSNGFPNNVETQEGLAVLSEYMSGNLNLTRLQELAYRVIATDSLTKGYSFAATFDLIHSQYKLDRDRAFNITLRIHRGGGWTKDALYLSGLKKIYDVYKSGADLTPVLLGKCSLEYQSKVEVIKSLGLVTPAAYHSKSFDQCLNTDKTVKFVLENLK